MCPTWITDQNGVWHPAKERVGLKNHSGKPIEIEQTSSDGKKFKQIIEPGMDYIYEGPDRAALFQWWEENGKPNAEAMKKLDGNVTFGEDFRGNMEFLEFFAKMKNALGLATMDEFLVYLGYDQKKYEERFKKNACVVSKHDLPARVEEVKKMGGGINTADPKQSKYGGFGTPEELSTAKA